MADPDIDDMRDTLRRVAAYREVCKAVRNGAGHTFFNGAFFLGITFLLYNVLGPHPIVLVNAAIGCGEILVALWKRFYPSAEGVLADSLLQFAFAASVGVRQGLLLMAGGRPNVLSVVICLWVTFDAFRTFQQYLVLRRLFGQRPSREHLAYFDDLVLEIRDSDPESDPQSLDLPTHPHMKAKLLGDVAFFVESKSGSVLVAARDEVDLDRSGGGGARLPVGLLTIEGDSFPEFALSPANWRNYAQWKTEGGDPPPPPEVRPAGE